MKYGLTFDDEESGTLTVTPLDSDHTHLCSLEAEGEFWFETIEDLRTFVRRLGEYAEELDNDLG